MAANHLKKITAKAKQLRKANPKMKWTDAIKKASASIRGVAKKSAPKKRAVKKAAPKKVAKKAAKKTAVKRHIDTKSHNVNIRVVSGISNSAQENLFQYKQLLQREKETKTKIEHWKEVQKKETIPSEKNKYTSLIKSFQQQLKFIREMKSIQKKLI